MHGSADDPIEPAKALGPWRLLREIGRGSWGAVYLAQRSDAPAAPVALKVLLEERASEEAQARFGLEVEVARRLVHPGIVPLLEAGRSAGRAWYAMEYCPGPTLHRRLQERGRLPLVEAVALVAELARAAHFAHEQGVVHRDLKPANVLLCGPELRPRITDFGLARAPDLLRSLTATGQMVGTPLVMAPEQLRGERDVDRRADVYALGAILYRCLTGRFPHEGPSTGAVVSAALQDPVVPPSRHEPGVPPWLDAVCLQALARDPAWRHATAEELAVALERGPAAAPAPPTPPGRQRAWHVPAAAGALVLGGALLGGWLARRGAPAQDVRPATPAPPPPPPPARPPPPAPRLAPEESVAMLERGALELTRIMREHTRRDALREAEAAAPRLAAAFPEDERVLALAQILAPAVSDGAIGLRRRFLRAAACPAPLPDGGLGLGARLCLELGFHRAAADLTARVERQGRIDHDWGGLSRVQVLMKAAPPVRDWPAAIAAARAILRHQGEQGGPSDRFLPPTWDVHANLAELLLASGDRTQAVAAYRDGASAADSPEVRQFLQQRADQVEQGAVRVEEALLLVRTSFALDEFTSRMATADDDGVPPTDAAGLLEQLGTACRSAGRHDQAALAELRAARAWRRARDPRRTLEALERGYADGRRAGADARDVRVLLARELARELLAVEPRRAESLARHATDPWPAGEVDLLTEGERAEAWVLLGQALLAQGRVDAARDALAEARRLAPPDRRELEALQAALPR